MKNKFLLLAVVFCLTSCSIFQKTLKNKEFLKIDSSGVKSTIETFVDTGSFKTYTKISIIYPPLIKNKNGFDLRFPIDLIKTTGELVNSSLNLKDSTKVFGASSGGLIIVGEKWTNEKKGTTQSSQQIEKTDLKKKTENTNSTSEGSSKLVLILCVCGGFVIIIIGIFVFLYYKSGKNLKDLFKLN